jgi:hypothetical protein
MKNYLWQMKEKVAYIWWLIPKASTWMMWEQQG